MIDVIEQLKDAVSTKDFKERYDKLLGLYNLSLSDKDKPKSEQLFYPELKALVFRFYKDAYDVSEKNSPSCNIRKMVL